MGTVKYTGPVASFHCPTNAEIRSLKVHFSPKQLGEGTPSPDNVREIEGWDGVCVHNDDGIIIPEEYQKVEYIENSGLQWIDTGLLYYQNDTIDITFMPTSENVDRSIFGVYQDDTKRCELNIYTGVFRFDVKYSSPRQNCIINNKYSIHRSNAKWYLNDQYIISAVNNNIDGHSILLFARWYQNSVTKISYARIYNYRHICNGVVHNFIPCRRKSDNKPGMYDTVTGQFFTNQGSGEFICGPDVGLTTNYEFGVLGKNKFNNDIPYKTIEGPANKIQNKEDLLAGLATGQMIFYGLSQIVSTDKEISYNVNNQVNIIMKVALNTTYCFSGSIDGGTRTEHFIKGISYLDADFIKLSTGTQTNGVFTVPNDSQIKYVCVYVHNYAQSSSQNPWSISDVLNSLQIELGSTATAYEPYDPNHTVYGGWVDLITGEVQEEWKFKDLSTSNTTVRTTTNLQYPYYMRTELNDWVRSIDNLLFNIIPSTQTNATFRSATCGWQLPGSSPVIYWVHPDCATEEGAESLRTNTDIKLIYKVSEANSSTYSLAPTQLQTFLGHNNVWSNADYVEVEYDLHETQDLLQRKAFIMANQPHIVTPAAAPLQNFKTDVIAPLKECKVHFGPMQEGTGDPSPDNVREVRGWDSLNIYHAPEYHLMIPLNNTSVSANGITISYLNNGQYNVYGTATANAKITIYTQSFIIPSGTGRYFHMNNSPLANGSNIYFITSNGSNIDVWNLASENRTSTTYVAMAGKEVGGFRIYVPNNSTVDFKLRPEFGNSRTQTTTTIDWTTEAGTVYGGYVDLVRGVLVQEYILLENTWGQWTLHGTQTNTDRKYLDINTDIYDSSQYSLVSTISNITRYSYSWIELDAPHFYVSTARRIYMWLPIGTDSSTVIQVIGHLTTPIVTQLTPQQLKSLRGTNNIWSNTNGNIELAYWSH